MGEVAPKSNVVEVADLVSQWGRRNHKARVARLLECFRGSHPRHVVEGLYVNKGDPMGQAELVGANKPTTRGGPDDRSEVRLADSTRSVGEPRTGGSGQQGLNRLSET